LLSDEHRLAVLTLSGIVFLALTVLVARQAVTLVRRKPRLFDASLHELERDHEQLDRRP